MTFEFFLRLRNGPPLKRVNRTVPNRPKPVDFPGGCIYQSTCLRICRQVQVMVLKNLLYTRRGGYKYEHGINAKNYQVNKSALFLARMIVTSLFLVAVI